MVQEAIKRVQQMEQDFDLLQKTAKEDPAALRKDPIFRAKLESLRRYYDGGQWLRDYELDGQGLLPKDLKRGILAQDTLYNFFENLPNTPPKVQGDDATLPDKTAPTAFAVGAVLSAPAVLPKSTASRFKLFLKFYVKYT